MRAALIASLLQLVGLGLLVSAAFMIAPIVGVTAAGLAVGGVGLAMEHPASKRAR